jgi:energy-coupling factor transporter ATP-binding protein EcfA2
LKLKGVRAPGGIRRLCAELLGRVNLTFAARRKVKTYSGGMRQRLGLAQAIAGDPRLIIVDEPTAGLDPEERLRFYYLLAELAEKRTVIMSTHIVEDVAVLCSRSQSFATAGSLLTRRRPRHGLPWPARYLKERAISPNWQNCGKAAASLRPSSWREQTACAWTI